MEANAAVCWRDDRRLTMLLIDVASIVARSSKKSDFRRRAACGMNHRARFKLLPTHGAAAVTRRIFRIEYDIMHRFMSACAANFEI